MQPRVTGVREQNALGANGQITKVLVVTYYVGSYGPFTLTTNQNDLASGAAMTAMQNFASTLAALPTGTAAS
jgi:hypothetical protein